MGKSCILFCRCTAGLLSEEKLSHISNQLALLDTDVYELYDLCALSIDQKDFLKKIESSYEQKLVIACYPRAVEKMLVQAGTSFTGLRILNFRELSVERMQEKLKTDHSFVEGKARFEQIKSKLEVPAWFPVIDQERCTSCGQCAKFCLFGVYRFQDKKLEVVHPLNCKNLCPACGRTCPGSAIIFPRLKENTALAGAVPGQIKIAMGDATETSMVSMLHARSQIRRSILRPGVIAQAEEERRKALEQLKMNNEK